MKKSLCLILTMFLFVGTSINAQNDVLQELINNMVLVEGKLTFKDRISLSITQMKQL